MIPYQFDPVTTWAEQNTVHLKVFDPELVPVLLDFVQKANLFCEPLQETDAFTEYRLLCNEDELNRLDTHLRLHSSAKD